jgi:tetratricopeptide (TPR) repeat protein
MHYRFAPLILLLALGVAPAMAQQPPANGAKIVIGDDQRLMFAAMQAAIKKDYKTAEDMYSRMIALNPRDTNAYLQRGIMRRQMGNEAGALADGKSVVILANTSLQADPRAGALYYMRGMGFRLLKDYTQAEKDVQTAITQGGPPEWKTDLRAIELEKKVRG